MTDKDAGWLAGFIDGEGCFACRVADRTHKGGGYNVRVWLNITQGVSRIHALKYARELFKGFSRIQISRKSNGNPRWQDTYRLLVGTNKIDLAKTIDVLDQCPFVTKAKEYVLWREAAMLAINSHPRKWDAKQRERVAKIAQTLTKMRNPQLYPTDSSLRGHEEGY